MKTFWLQLLLIGQFLVACSSEPAPFKTLISTEEPAPMVVAEAIKTLARAGLKLEAMPMTSRDDIFAQLQSGEADFAVIEEPGRRMPGLTTILPLYPSILHVLVHRDITVDSLESLVSGRSIYAGPTDGTAARLLHQLADDHIMTGQSYRLLDNPWAEAPEVYFILGGLLSSEALKDLKDYRMFSFGDPSELGAGTIAEGLALKYPNVHPFILPAEVYGGFNAAPILTLFTRTVLISRDDYQIEPVYEMTRYLLEHANDLALAYPLVTRELHENFDPSALMMPLHGGSRRFIERDEPSFLERYAEVIAVLMAISATVGSGGLWLWRYNLARRKDRIDIFYRRILEIRARALSEDNDTPISELRLAVCQAQEEVFQLLVQERIDANAALTSFVNFSNQVLKELSSQLE